VRDDLRRELRLRLASGVVLAGVAITGAWLGGWAFAILVGAFAALTAGEWGALVARRYGVPALRLAALAGAGAAAVGGVLLVRLVGLPAALAGIAVVSLGAALLGMERRWPYRWLALGVGYVALTPTLLVWMRDAEPGGLVYVVFLFAAVWASDIGAFVTGRTFGGPKLAPVWSPNKTWSGLVGAMLAAGLAGGAVAWAFDLPFLAMSVVLGAILGGTAQAGDLFESRFKRLAHTKDASHLIPGHGGALDRLDGLMFATPVFAGFVALHP
jgi:phosphatidate cytidylyltransferase